MHTDCVVVSVILSTARSHDVVIGVASSLSTFSLASVLFLTIGLACGCYCGWKWGKDKSMENQQTTQPTQPNLLHEDIVIQKQELELKENYTAYRAVGQFNSIIS